MAEDAKEDTNDLDELLSKEFAKAEEPQATEEQEPEQVIPEKYAGKDVNALIRMHQDAERLIGKHSNEVGELRKVVDDILAAQAQPSTAPEPEEDVDWFDDPTKATTTTVTKTVKPLEEKLDRLEQRAVQQDQQRAMETLVRRHPDAGEITNSEAFKQWVSSNAARQRLYEDANRNFDVEAGAALLDDYKERQGIKQESGTKRTNDVRQAATGAGRASGENGRKAPVFSRDAIVELKRTDPAKYARLLPQIKQAYIEGRYTK